MLLVKHMKKQRQCGWHVPVDSTVACHSPMLRYECFKKTKYGILQVKKIRVIRGSTWIFPEDRGTGRNCSGLLYVAIISSLRGRRDNGEIKALCSTVGRHIVASRTVSILPL